MPSKQAAEKSRAAPEAKAAAAPASAGKGKDSAASATRGGAKLDAADNVGVQAVWLLDAFDSVGLAPVTLDTALWNLHIAGVPAVEYGLEWLTSQEDAAVAEIILFARTDADGLRAYLSSSPRWSKHVTSADVDAACVPRIRVLTSPRAVTAGDAMRFVDDAGVIRADTLIVCDGIIISNAQLKQALDAHAVRATHDSNSIVTVLCASFQPASCPRTQSLPCAYVPLAEQHRLSVDPASGRIVAYDTLPADSARMYDAVSKKALSECPAAVQLQSVYDCRVYIASPAMLVHFNDNYDYKSIRQQYLHNEIQNVELGFKFHAHVLDSSYCAPVADLRGLARVTRDLLDGWVGALHPAAGMLVDGPWMCTATGAYIHASARVHATARVDAGSIICAHATVGEHAIVRGSVIGACATLASSVVVVRSVLDSHARVEARAHLNHAYMGSHASVAAAVLLPDGNVVGARAMVTLSQPPFSHVTCAARPTSDFDDDDDEDGAAAQRTGVPSITAAGDSEASVVGEHGIGRAWPCATEVDGVLRTHGDDDDDEAEGASTDTASIAAVVRTAAERITELRAVTAVAVAAVHSLNDESMRVAYAALKHVPALVRMPLVSSSCAAEPIAAAASVYRALASMPAVVTATAQPSASAVAATRDPLQRFQDGLRDFLPPVGSEVTAADMRNTTLQIKSFRYAENRSIGDALAVILPYVLDRVPRVSTSKGSVTLMSMLSSMKSIMTQWAPLLGSTESAIEDQLAGIDTVAKYCLAPANATDFKPIFGLIVQTMWELDLALDGAVSEWAAAAEESSDAGIRELRTSKWMERLMEQLDEELEDDDDAEGGDDEEEDDEEADDE